jgi:hypothetical protein
MGQHKGSSNQLKRLPRNPLKFDPIELFSAVSRDNNYKIEAEDDINDFLEKVGLSLKASLKNQNILHGKRVEALFAHVAGALGQCAMIKQEDSGNIFASGKPIQAPDYSITLQDGNRFLVEVKNCHHGDPKAGYEFRKDYVERLETYAALQGTTVKFAIYFSRIRKWVLISKGSMTEHRNKYTTTFIEAYAKNEMIVLGDRMIGTTPNLAVELVSSVDNEAIVTDDGQASITIGDVKIYCAGNEIVVGADKNIAFYLIRFGTWTTDTPAARMDGDRVLSVRYEFYPDVPWEEEQGFAMLGELSSMVTSAYNEHTVYESRIVALDARVDPEVFSVKIPDGYTGDQLPLWQFALQPNLEFKLSQ